MFVLVALAPSPIATPELLAVVATFPALMAIENASTDAAPGPAVAVVDDDVPCNAVPADATGTPPSMTDSTPPNSIARILSLRFREAPLRPFLVCWQANSEATVQQHIEAFHTTEYTLFILLYWREPTSGTALVEITTYKTQLCKASN
jgi:hypothetical protein